jgi:hypothetical protein
VPDKADAHILKIFRRQLRQDFFVNLVVAECRFVLFEAKAPQPTSDIHNGEWPCSDGNLREDSPRRLLSRLAETPSLMASFSLSSTESRYIGIYHHNLAPRSGTAEIRARIFCDQIRRGYVALFYKPFLDDLRERLRSADHGRTGVARGVIH